MTNSVSTGFKAGALPPGVGIGLRFIHLDDLLRERPPLAALECHTENLFDLPPAIFHKLYRLREIYPFSLHGIGLSLGSADGIDHRHLARVAEVVKLFEPNWLSDHASWSGCNGVRLPELLPLPFTKSALDVLVNNIDMCQSVLRRSLAVENIAAYVTWPEAEYSEAEFLNTLSERCGCQLLLDLNNLYVNEVNLGRSASATLADLDYRRLASVHLAGPSVAEGGLLDTHSSAVPEPVWQLYDDLCARATPALTVVEWDQEVPPLARLLDEVALAARRLARA